MSVPPAYSAHDGFISWNSCVKPKLLHGASTVGKPAESEKVVERQVQGQRDIEGHDALGRVVGLELRQQGLPEV